MFLVPSARHKNTLRFSVWSLRAWVLAWRALSSPDLDGRCRPEIFASEKRARPQRALRTQRPLALAWPGAREMHAWRVSSSSKYRQLMLWRARIAAALVSMPTWRAKGAHAPRKSSSSKWRRRVLWRIRAAVLPGSTPLTRHAWGPHLARR